MLLAELLNTIPNGVNNKEQIRTEVVSTYFTYILPIFKFYRQSENYKSNKDLQKIRIKTIKQSTSITFKSERIKAYLHTNELENSILQKTNISKEERQIIENGILSEFVYIESAALLLSTIIIKQSETYLKWYVSIILTLVGFLVTIYFK